MDPVALAASPDPAPDPALARPLSSANPRLRAVYVPRRCTHSGCAAAGLARGPRSR